MKSKLAWSLLALIGAYQVIRQLGQRSGATDEEVDGALPGDEVIPHPMIETTHAITISAPPSEVWPWLVQAGYRGSGRAGGIPTRRSIRRRYLLSHDHASGSPTVRSCLDA
jgi:hypothetical protein